MQAAIMTSGLCLIGVAGLTSGGFVQSDAEMASASRDQNQPLRMPQLLMRGPFAVPAANDDRLRTQALRFRVSSAQPKMAPRWPGRKNSSVRNARHVTRSCASKRD